MVVQFTFAWFTTGASKSVRKYRSIIEARGAKHLKKIINEVSNGLILAIGEKEVVFFW
jgi:hypothetical protein